MVLRIKKEDYTTTEKLFLIIWTFYSVTTFVLGSELGYDYDLGILSRYTAYATIFLQVLMFFFLKRYKLFDFLKYIAILGVLLAVEISNSDRSLLIYVLFVILAQYIDVEKLLRYDIILKICILAVIVGMSLVGITSNYSAVINDNYKQAWGFSHPNVFTGYALIILVEWLCARYKSMKWPEWLLIVLCALAIMQIGGGRSSIYTFAVVLLLYLLAKFAHRIFLLKPVRIAFMVITPLMAIISFWVVSLYNQGNAAVIALNTVMTGRISLAARFLNTYSIGLFGQEIEYVGSRASQASNIAANILDNAYIRCALDWGLLVLVAIIISYVILFRKLLNSQRIDFALLCLFFVLLGIGETYMLRPVYNLSLLCLLGFHNDNVDTNLENMRLRKRKPFRLRVK